MWSIRWHAGHTWLLHHEGTDDADDVWVVEDGHGPLDHGPHGESVPAGGSVRLMMTSDFDHLRPTHVRVKWAGNAEGQIVAVQGGPG